MKNFFSRDPLSFILIPVVLGAEATAGFTDVETVYQHKMVINAGTFMSKISTELTNDFALLFKPGYVIHITRLPPFLDSHRPYRVFPQNLD
jgi:hypothetical protein